MKTAPSDELPVIKKKKKINIRKLEALAKRVRASFEEQRKYIQKQRNENEYRDSSGFLQNP